MAIMLITHALGVVAEMPSAWWSCMPGRSSRRAGGGVFANPRHPYTQGLLTRDPAVDAERETGCGSSRSRASCRACSIRRRAAAFAARCGFATARLQRAAPSRSCAIGAPPATATVGVASCERGAALFSRSATSKHFPSRGDFWRARSRA